MGYRFRTAMFSTVALIGIAATPVFAQAPAGGANEGGDIVVTARRREENLIDVPIAISAISGTQLEQRGAIDITDIGNTAPNVTLEVSRGTNSTLSAFIRGVGQQDPVAGFEAGVGLYLDDVYLNRPQGAVLDIYDVERIEVLRGPQGTLYGRNTIGGAVKYVTRRLGTDPTLSLRGAYGSYNQLDGVVSASVPVGDGTLRFGGAVARLTRDGFGRNLTTNQQNYNKNVLAGRLTAEVHGTGIFARLAADYTRDKSNTRGGHRLITSLASGAPVLANVFDSRGALIAPTQDVEAYGVSLFLEGKPTDWLTVRSITAYRQDDSATPIDFDALPAVDVDVPAFYNNKQTSQELQFLIDAGRFNGLIGAYYLNAKSRTVFDVRLPGTVTALTFGNVATDTAAIFGDFTFDLTDQLSLSAGGRYTWDRRTSQIQRNVYLGASPFFGGTSAPIVRQTDFTGSADFKQFTPRASVSFKPTPDHNIYASYSKGFKGGGFDPRGVGTAAPDLNGNGVTGAGGDQADIYTFLSFRPEKVDSYEIGWKGALFDRTFTFALTGFQADYTDVQVPGSVGAVVGGVQTFIGITTNAGRARFRGVEFEGNLVARDAFIDGARLGLQFAVGYIDARYTRFIDARGIDVANRRRIQNTPDWTISETLSYNVPVGSGRLNASATLAYRGDSQQFELATPGLDQRRYALLDASLVYTGENDRWSVGIHGRNLTNRRYIVAGYNFLRQNPDTAQFILANGTPGISSTLGSEGVLTAYYGNPRQVFATVGFKF
jgi:iron complex outermembrane recepter protein